MTGSTLQQLAKGIWRILEVYLFFIVSVLGFTGLGKAPFSVNNKKDKPNTGQVVRHLSDAVFTPLVFPPAVAKQMMLLATRRVCGLPAKEKTSSSTETEPQRAATCSTIAKPHDAPAFFETFDFLRYQDCKPHQSSAAYLHVSKRLQKFLPQLQAPLLI